LISGHGDAGNDHEFPVGRGHRYRLDVRLRSGVRDRHTTAGIGDALASPLPADSTAEWSSGRKQSLAQCSDWSECRRS
jgi:hypothetical protein